MHYYYYYCIFSDEEIDDEEETADVEKEQRGGRKFPRSAVDDNFFRFVLLSKELDCLFFSLAEMRAFLDAEDKRVGDPEIIGADEVREWIWIVYCEIHISKMDRMMFSQKCTN